MWKARSGCELVWIAGSGSAWKWCQYRYATLPCKHLLRPSRVRYLRCNHPPGKCCNLELDFNFSSIICRELFAKSGEGFVPWVTFLEELQSQLCFSAYLGYLQTKPSNENFVVPGGASSLSFLYSFITKYIHTVPAGHFMVKTEKVASRKIMTYWVWIPWRCFPECSIFLLFFPLVTISVEVIKKSQNSRNQVFLTSFCLVMEGSGIRSGSGPYKLW